MIIHESETFLFVVSHFNKSLEYFNREELSFSMSKIVIWNSWTLDSSLCLGWGAPPFLSPVYQMVKGYIVTDIFNWVQAPLKLAFQFPILDKDEHIIDKVQLYQYYTVDYLWHSDKASIYETKKG
jgi:hypothetical protein